MEKEIEKYVLMLLEGYSATSRKINLIRYELQHHKTVSPEEMIEAMALSRKEGQANNLFPHDVEGIALCYREIAEKFNRAAADDILTEYLSLLRERERLLYYIGMLEPQQSAVVHGHYVQQRSWLDISKAMGITKRTAYKIRKAAIETLVQYYSFMKDMIYHGEHMQNEP